MITDYVLEDGHVGQVISAAPNGFVVDISQSQSMQKNDYPQWSETGRHWKTCYFELRGSKSFQDIFAVCPSQSPAPPSTFGGRRYYLVSGSIPFYGDLILLCLPRGSQWQVSISDVPLTRREQDGRTEAMRLRLEMQAIEGLLDPLRERELELVHRLGG